VVGELVVGELVVRELVVRELVVGQLVVRELLVCRRLERRVRLVTGQPPPQQHRAVGAVAAACVLAAVALSVLAGWGQPQWWGAPALGLLVFASEIAVVHLQMGRQRWTFSLTEAVIGGAILLQPGAWAVTAVVGGVLAAQTVRRQPILKLAFNVSQFAASSAMAQWVAQQTGGGITGAVLGMAAFWVLNYTLVAVAVSLTSQRRFLVLVASSGPISLLHMAGNTSIGLLAAFLAEEAPLGLLGLVVPLGLLWASYDQETRRSAEARLFAELARGQEQAANRSSDVSAHVVVQAAARLFGGADVEMVLLANDGPVRFTGDEHGQARRTRVEQDAFDEPWVLRAMGTGRVSAGVDERRPYCTAVLGDPDAPLAVLVARRGVGAAPFGRRDQRLASVLAVQAEQWLSVSALSARYEQVANQAKAADGAARALGDLGAATAPALSVLRDSAGRLSRLVDGDLGGGVDDIVGELHLVERAVASLLGAIALAAEPELLTGQPTGQMTPPLALPTRAAMDWTTTGTLR
jgi:hypothetical protein